MNKDKLIKESIKEFREEFGTTAKDRIVEINVNFVEQFLTTQLEKAWDESVKDMKHIHDWIQTKKWITRDGWWYKLFDPIYRANISKCKCGEWYYITVK